MITYEPLIGESIDRAVTEMCSLAETSGETVRATFNGIDLAARPGAVPSEIERSWRARLDARSAAYRESPEGRAAAFRRERQVVERQQSVDDLVAEMRSTLNAEDVPAVLVWLKRLADVGDDVDVRVPNGVILRWFAEHGYEAGVNCGDAFDAEDRENVARRIIGQALDGIRVVGAPHSIVHRFADEWLAAS